MKYSVDEITKGISTFIEYFRFEPLDPTTTECIEQQVGSWLESIGLEFSEYYIRTTIFDINSMKVNLEFDGNNIDFFIMRS